MHKLLDGTKLISNQAGCGEQWEAARPGEGDVPCTAVDACSRESSPCTLSRLPFPTSPHVSQVQRLRQWWVPAQATFQMSFFVRKTVEEIQEMFTKDLEELKDKQS